MSVYTSSIIHEADWVLNNRPPLPISTGACSGVDDPSQGHDVADSAIASKDMPALRHRWNLSQAILCVLPAPSLNLLFCGTQTGCILVYDLNSYSLKCTIKGGDVDQSHSILCMEINPEETHLFSAGSDSLVKVWDISCWKKAKVDEPPSCSSNPENDRLGDECTEPYCAYIIYTIVDIGDIFSIAWSSKLSTIFIGAQNAAIVWCRVYISSAKHSHSCSELRMPHLRYDKFFDSKGPGGSVNIVQSKHEEWRNTVVPSGKHKSMLIEVNQDHCIQFAHHGFVYCMELSNHDSSKGPVLYTGGGDGFVNVWQLFRKESGDLEVTRIHSLDNEEPVLSMLQSDYLYVGLSHSIINMWDLTTYQLIRLFRPANFCVNDDALSLAIDNGFIYKASNMGGLSMFSLEQIKAGRGLTQVPVKAIAFNAKDPRDPRDAATNESESVLAVKVFTNERRKTFLVSGGTSCLDVWDITANHRCDSGPRLSQDLKKRGLTLFSDYSNENLLSSLATFISYKTISKLPALYLEDSRRCAQFLSQLLSGLGARQNQLLPVANANPIVYARFQRNIKGKSYTTPAKVLLWYGHYDVVDATGHEALGWSTDPFVLAARDGSLYARGSSDNKGPTLAAAFAIAELYQKGELPCDVVFVVEGEEECGLVGFQDAIQKHKPVIGTVDWIMLSNSYWLDDEIPCLNYGLRGVVTAKVTVTSEKPDRHSGVDGGVSREPTMDLVQLLATLVDKESGRINLPRFYDEVLPLSAKELEIFAKIAKVSAAHDIETLKSKWATPSLTVHKVVVSGPNNNTVIPQTAEATVSIRIVANQQVSDVQVALETYLEEQFRELKSPNKKHVDVFHSAEPWLGDPENQIYSILRKKIKEHWHVEPLFVREGGLIPSIRFLEKCFNALAAQIPCGQASDNAHLKDEKLRLLNLYKLRDILKASVKEFI